MLPNLMATKWGRLLTFFLLYITEGIPLGFTSTVMAVQLRRAGVSPEEVGLFVGTLYLPWAWKWVAGPFVDLLYSNRLGRRRAWIVGTQVMLCLTLLACMPLKLPDHLAWLTRIILIHNCFAATMDVAIDALACSTLKPDEKGVANGLMFGGQSLGQTIGGACVLYLVNGLDWLPGLARGISMPAAYGFVVVSILLITVFVALPIREEPAPREKSGADALSEAFHQVQSYAVTAWRSFFADRVSTVAFAMSLLPVGAHALGLALQNNVAVELGFDDGQIADLQLASTVASALGSLLGGWLSDRLGRLRMLAVFVALTAVPTLWLAWCMQRHGWIMPVDVNAALRPEPSAALVQQFRLATIAFNMAYGLTVAAQVALYMNLVNPRVAATQFTAYMGLMNLVTAYTAWWQGLVITRYGYPVTLALDGLAGLLCVLCFPLLVIRSSPSLPCNPDAAGLRH